MYKVRAGQTVVQGNNDLILDATSKILELRHVLCGNKKICVNTDELTAHITVTKGVTTQLSDGTCRTKIHVSGKLLYQPVAGCGVPYSNGCSPCEPCPEEDVIFASFNVYSNDANLFIVATQSTATPITHSNCQDFTSQVLIEVPYNIYLTSVAAAPEAKAKEAVATTKSK